MSKALTLTEKAEIAVRAARMCAMTGKIWEKNDSEIRVYLRRTNAAETEAGYIRLWKDQNKKYWSRYVQTATGRGSRTAESEAEAVYAKYLQLRKAAEAAKG